MALYPSNTTYLSVAGDLVDTANTGTPSVVQE